MNRTLGDLLVKMLFICVVLALFVVMRSLAPETTEPYITYKEFRDDSGSEVTRIWATFNYNTPIQDTEHKIDLVATKEDGSEIIKSITDKPVKKHNEETAIFHLNKDELSDTENIKLDLRISFKDPDAFNKKFPTWRNTNK